MINSGTAEGNTCKNTTCVWLEVVGGGSNWDRDGLLVSGSLESSNWVNCSLGEGCNTDWWGLGSTVCASTIHSSVSIVGFEVSFVAFKISESTWLPTTTAAEAGLNAINELLFSEGKELTSLNLVGTFEGSSWGESPAWTALTLILNGVDCTLVNPVPSSSPVWHSVGDGSLNFGDFSSVELTTE